MPMQLEIPDDLAQELAERATHTGAKPEQFALAALRRSLAEEKRLAESLAPIHEAFEQSGMTEDELSDLLEEEKHAMRRDESLATIRQVFEESGLTEGEAVELFEAEKHAMRRGE